MSAILPEDLKELIARQLATGRYRSEEDVLRSALSALAEYDEDLVAVQQALVEWRDGDAGTPLDVACDQIRRGGR